MTRCGCLHVSRQKGFSLIEALVVLTVTSLILAAIMPISIRSIAGNLAVGERSLTVISRAIDEAAFRVLLGSAIPERQTLTSAAGRFTINGDGSRIEMISLSELGAGCAEAARESRISLVIERDGRGGRLACVGPSTRRVLANWSSGEASFSYSSDGVEWVSQWPTREQVETWERLLATALSESGGAPLVLAPLVRFEVRGAGSDALVWIERAGDTGPVEFDSDFLFSGQLFGGGL